MGSNNFFRQTFGSVVDPLLGKAPEMPKVPSMEPPPTLEDAKKKSADSEALRTKTYGRMGTIKNTGGQRGLASSTLNLAAPTLLGK